MRKEEGEENNLFKFEGRNKVHKYSVGSELNLLFLKVCVSNYWNSL